MGIIEITVLILIILKTTGAADFSFWFIVTPSLFLLAITILRIAAISSNKKSNYKRK